MKKRRIDKVGQKYKGKKESQYSPTTFSNKCYESRFKNCCSGSASFVILISTFLSLFIYFFTQKQRPPAGLSLCQSLSPSGSEVSPGSVHRVLSIPPPGPHGYFPSMIQEFGVKGRKGGLWLLQVKVELKPEIGALVWSSGTEKDSGGVRSEKVFGDNERGAEMKAHILL